MANYVSRVNKYNKAESYIRNLLQEEVDAGRMQQEDMEAMLNRKTSTLADIGNKVSSIITPLVETRQFDEETFKSLWDFAVATGEKEIAEACINRVQSDRRNAVANIINEKTGGKKVSANGLELLGGGSRRKGKPRFYEVVLNTARHDTGDLELIRDTLLKHPGKTPVRLTFRNSLGNSASIELGAKYCVTPDQDLDEALSLYS